MRACLIAAVAFTLMLPDARRSFSDGGSAFGAEAAVPGQVRAADLNLALGQLQRTVETLPPGQRPPRLVAAVEWLVRRGATTNPANVSAEYVRSLLQAADLLRHPSADAIDDVTSELEAKVDHCRALGIGMGGSVLLRVSTRRGSQMVSDWQVLYLLKIYERVSAASPVTFPALSTPTDARLEPGRYWIWARDPATGRTSERALLRVAGQTEFRVDLPVP